MLGKYLEKCKKILIENRGESPLLQLRADPRDESHFQSALIVDLRSSAVDMNYLGWSSASSNVDSIARMKKAADCWWVSPYFAPILAAIAW